MRQRWGVIVLVSVISFLSGGWLLQRGTSGANVYQQARLFDDVLGHVSAYYVDSLGETDLFKQFICTMTRLAVGRRRNHCRREHIFNHGTLRQQAVVLKHKTDLLITKSGKLFRVQQERILTAERHRAARRWFERAYHVKQSALAAARRSHDRDRRARRQ